MPYGSLIRNPRGATRIRVVRGNSRRRYGHPGSRSRRRRTAPLLRLILLASPGIMGLAYGLYRLGHEAPGWAAPGFLLGMVCCVCAIITFLGDAPAWVRFVAVAVNLAGALLLI